MFWTLYSSKCDSLDREDIRHEEEEGSNQEYETCELSSTV